MKAAGDRLNRWAGRGVLLALAVLLLTAIPVSPASAHPLGNFVINHYNGLHLTPDSIENYAVIDSAELPTLTQTNIVDADGDESVSSEERAAFASEECAVVASQQQLTVAGDSAAWQVSSAEFTYSPGQGGLDISRLDCRFTTKVDLGTPAKVIFVDNYLSDRTGWREITATSDGVALDNSPVPAESRSDELRVYPDALLQSPLDEREVELSASPGVGVSAGEALAVEEVGGVTRVLQQLTDRLSALAGDRDLTLGVGLLAVLLALVLGASHAALPGHGKTIMAAYMVGTRGTPRDAVLIGVTVTFAHTVGVLILGALFSAGASFAGERVLAVLGVVSGALVVVIGLGLLWTAARRRSGATAADGSQQLFGHGHGHGHGHGYGHGHSEAPSDDLSRQHTHAVPDRHHGHTGASSIPLARADVVVLDAGSEPAAIAAAEREAGADKGFRRLTLMGMGLAGGLVPSPTALLVLIICIGLGRTAFGVLLVVAYGAGMAAVLIAVGYLIARLPQRISWLRDVAKRPIFAGLLKVAPVLTAGLVLLVGIGLTLRSLTQLV